MIKHLSGRVNWWSEPSAERHMLQGNSKPPGQRSGVVGSTIFHSVLDAGCYWLTSPSICLLSDLSTAGSVAMQWTEWEKVLSLPGNHTGEESPACDQLPACGTGSSVSKLSFIVLCERLGKNHLCYWILPATEVAACLCCCCLPFLGPLKKDTKWLQLVWCLHEEFLIPLELFTFAFLFLPL